MLSALPHTVSYDLPSSMEKILQFFRNSRREHRHSHHLNDLPELKWEPGSGQIRIPAWLCGNLETIATSISTDQTRDILRVPVRCAITYLKKFQFMAGNRGPWFR